MAKPELTPNLGNQTNRRNDNLLPILGPEDRLALFHEERENYRHQDSSRWSRIQTVALIEGGMLWAIFWQPVNNWLSLMIAIGGSLIALLVCMMALKDASDARWHLSRIRQLEKQMGIDVVPPRPYEFWRRSRQVAKLLVFGAVSEDIAKKCRDDVPGGIHLLEWSVRVATVSNAILIIYCLVNVMVGGDDNAPAFLISGS